MIVLSPRAEPSGARCYGAVGDSLGSTGNATATLVPSPGRLDTDRPAERVDAIGEADEARAAGSIGSG